MADPRWQELATILIDYSTATRPGDRVFITMMEAETLPLTQAVYGAAIRAGALPYIEFQSASLDRQLLLHGSAEQLAWLPEIPAYAMKWADVYIGLRGASNPHEFHDIPTARIAAFRKTAGQISALRTEQTRWVLVRVPNAAFAQQAQTSLEEILAFFFEATLRDWEAEAARYRQLQQVFAAATTVRIVGEGTDLTFSTAGRHYVVEDGHINMPGGEIFTAPVDDSAEGEIYFEFPGVFAGQLVEGIRLRFAAGQVVDASAASNEAFLHQLLQLDEGARRIGEFGVGTNFGIQRFTQDILFDEKIGGTVHLALGRAYAACGGTNYSSLHWDIIKDLRQSGAVYLDGRKVIEQGQFLL
jgi:aminopeptidase